MKIRNLIFAGAVCASFSLAAFGQTVPKGDAPVTPTNSEAKPSTIKKGSLSNVVVVIPLKGIVGPTLDGDEWFSATDFEKALAKAEKLGPAAIILEIKSPRWTGGRRCVISYRRRARARTSTRGGRSIVASLLTMCICLP